MAKDKKIFWFDTETTGTDPKIHGIVQLAVLMEVNNKVEEAFNARMRILPGKIVDPKALEVTGLTQAQVTKDFEDPVVVYEELNEFMKRHGTGLKEDRFIMAGYQSQFDCDMLNSWFNSISEGPYAYWKYLQHSPIDVLPTLRAMRYAGIIDTPDTKLGTMCKYFGIEINAHDAFSDIKATRELTTKVFHKIFSAWVGFPMGILGKLPEPEQYNNVGFSSLFKVANEGFSKAVIEGCIDQNQFDAWEEIRRMVSYNG